MDFNNKNIDLPAYIDSLVKYVMRKEGFSGYKYEQSPGSNGSLGVMIRIKLSGTLEYISGLTQTGDLHLICKMIDTNSIRREMFDAIPAFKNEIYFYTKILPEFVNFQKEKRISEDDGFFNFPKIYATHSDDVMKNYAIIMEDLTASGYSMSNKIDPIDFDHVKQFFEALGRFHAVSFGIRDQKPDVLKMYNSLDDVFENDERKKVPIQKYMFKLSMDRAIQSLEHEQDQRFIDKMKYIKDNTDEVVMQCINKQCSELFNVINHCDFWINNMMFLYNEAKKPHKICFIDWQLVRFGSPALDISFFMFTSTDQKLRTAHYKEFLHIYHKSLTKLLTQLGSNAEELFSYEHLQNQLQSFGKYGLIFAPMIIQIIWAPTFDGPELEQIFQEPDSEELQRKLKLFLEENGNDEFNIRVRDLIKDCIKLGYF